MRRVLAVAASTTLYLVIVPAIAMMATAGDRLMLSALKTDLPSSMNNNVSQKRCLIHVKLTEFCMKTVEHLIDSEKVMASHLATYSKLLCDCILQGAYFSLWFDENGGVSNFYLGGGGGGGGRQYKAFAYYVTA